MLCSYFLDCITLSYKLYCTHTLFGICFKQSYHSILHFMMNHKFWLREALNRCTTHTLGKKTMSSGGRYKTYYPGPHSSLSNHRLVVSTRTITLVPTHPCQITAWWSVQDLLPWSPLILVKSPPGGQYKNYYPGTHSSLSNHCNSFEDRVPDLQMSCSDLT